MDAQITLGAVLPHLLGEKYVGPLLDNVDHFSEPCPFLLEEFVNFHRYLINFSQFSSVFVKLSLLKKKRRTRTREFLDLQNAGKTTPKNPSVCANVLLRPEPPFARVSSLQIVAVKVFFFCAKLGR